MPISPLFRHRYFLGAARLSLSLSSLPRPKQAHEQISQKLTVSHMHPSRLDLVELQPLAWQRGQEEGNLAYGELRNSHQPPGE